MGLFKKNDTDLYIFEKQNDWKIPIFIDSSYLRLCQPNTPFKKKNNITVNLRSIFTNEKFLYVKSKVETANNILKIKLFYLKDLLFNY